MNPEELYNKVRLSKNEIDAIIEAFKTNYSENDSLWVFGSRVNLNAKGGDIDLYVETSNTDTKDVIDRKFKMVSQIWRKIGERKIDVVLNMLDHNQNLEIYNVAKRDGVRLV